MSKVTNPYTDGTLDLGALRFKPEDDEKGASITGRVIAIAPLESDKTGERRTAALVTVVDEDELRYEWASWGVRGNAELLRQRPLIGDRIRISFLGRDPTASSLAFAAKLWKIDVIERADGSKPDDRGDDRARDGHGP